MAGSDPFYDLYSTTTLISSTPVGHGNSSGVDYTFTLCHDDVGYSYNLPQFGIAYDWAGLPVKSHVNDEMNGPVAGALILVGQTSFGSFGILLNLFCGRLIVKNINISWAVKFYLLFDCYSRVNVSWMMYYKAWCVLTWECVNPLGFPISALTLNAVISSCNLSMVYCMQMLANGLCTNRIFAVFFNGLYYPKMEKIAFLHALALWLFPITAYCYQIGNLVNPVTGFICYGGWFYSPLHYCNVTSYSWDAIGQWLVTYFEKVMYGVFGVTFFLDLLTLWKVHTLTKRSTSNSKRRADVRLSIMLVTTHFITVTYLVLHWWTLNAFKGGLPVFYFLLMEVYPFTVQSIFGFVVIMFMLPSKSWKRPRIENQKRSSVTGLATQSTVLPID